MKKLAKTGLIVKKQQKLNELAAKEEQRLKDLASFIRDDSSPPPRLHTASSLRKEKSQRAAREQQLPQILNKAVLK
jgi:hypothetical protein